MIRIDCALSSCSAWLSRSSAIQSGSLSRVGDDEDLGRPGDHVDADAPEDPALGGGDKGVAGAGDLVDRRDGFGAVGQRRNRLRAADAVDRSSTPGESGGEQDQRVHLAVRGRAADDQPLDPGDRAGMAFISTEEG